jgi:5-methylcytosine-specific restriction endonuclease McrA
MRRVPPWVGVTDDTKVPDRVKQRVFDDHDGRCHVCDVNIGGKLWHLDHIIALINGGKHDESNLAPICIPCHWAKTGQDVKIKSKIAAVKARHDGIKRPTGDLHGRGFDKVAPKEKAPQRASLPPRTLYARRDK